MNLVIGSTGMVGTRVCSLLVDDGQAVRALVRARSNADRVRRLQARGVETVVGDLRDARSLATACAGVSAVIVTASAMPFSYEPDRNTPGTTDRDGVAKLVTAAQAAGVQHLVHTSFSGKIDQDFPLQNAKRAAERCVKESGLNFTILRPNFFMDVWLTPAVGFDPLQARARLYGGGRQAIGWIAANDVARYAVASLSHPRARSATLELDGPAALSPLEVVAIFERVSGRTFAVDHVPDDVLAQQEAAATDPMQQSFVALMRAYARGAVSDTSLQRTFGLTLTSVDEYAVHVLHAEETVLRPPA